MIKNGEQRREKPMTTVQAAAWSEGYSAFLKDQSVTENPHNTDVKHIWWRHGWLQARDDKQETPAEKGK